MQIDFKPVSKQTTHQHHHTPCNRPSHHPCGLWCMLVYVCLPGCVCCPVSRQYTARQTYTSMHHDPQGNTQPGRRTPACPQGNTHSQADVHQHASRPTGQHTQPGRRTYTSMHRDPQGNTHSQADVHQHAHRATHTARQTYVHQHASRPTGQHTQPGRRTPACPQGNTHSQADVRTPACIATHRATHTARQTYVHQHASRPTGARQYTSMHDDPQGNTHSQADIHPTARQMYTRHCLQHQFTVRPSDTKGVTLH